MNVLPAFHRRLQIWRKSGFWCFLGVLAFDLPIFRHVAGLLWPSHLVSKEIVGSIMWLDLADPGICRQLLTSGIREAHHTRDVRNAVARGMVGIDVGANIGYYALIEAGQVGDTGFVYCIEPEAHNFDILKRNIVANRFVDRVKLFNCAVGDRTGKALLYKSSLSNSHTLFARGDDAPTQEIPVVTLDHFIESQALSPQRVSFVRMDVEGYESHVLRGMQDLIARNPNLKLFIELHPAALSNLGEDLGQLLTELEDNGFWAVAATEELNSGQEVAVFRCENIAPTEIIHRLPIAGGGVQCCFAKRRDPE